MLYINVKLSHAETDTPVLTITVVTPVHRWLHNL